MAGAKVFYTIGGQGMKPDKYIKMVSPGRFTKGSRNAKPRRTSLPTPQTY